MSWHNNVYPWNVEAQVCKRQGKASNQWHNAIWWKDVEFSDSTKQQMQHSKRRGWKREAIRTFHTLILCVDFQKQWNIPLYFQRESLNTFKVIFNIADQLGFFHIWIMRQHRDWDASSRQLLLERNNFERNPKETEYSMFTKSLWCCRILSGAMQSNPLFGCNSFKQNWRYYACVD